MPEGLTSELRPSGTNWNLLHWVGAMWNWPLYSMWSVFELRLYGSQNLWIVRIILVPKPQFAQNLSYGLLALNPLFLIFSIFHKLCSRVWKVQTLCTGGLPWINFYFLSYITKYWPPTYFQTQNKNSFTYHPPLIIDRTWFERLI